jgi:hypothetical protein
MDIVILVMDISSHHMIFTFSVTSENVVGSGVYGQRYALCYAGDLYKINVTLTHVFTWLDLY